LVQEERLEQQTIVADLVQILYSALLLLLVVVVVVGIVRLYILD
jgi:hypothetical protein